MVDFKKILVPTDFSEESIPAYTHAQELAKKFGARVDIIHVVPTLKYFTESIGKLGVPFDMETDLYPHVKDGAEHQIEGVMDDYFKEEQKGDPVVLIERTPSRTIAEYADEHNYDLIVMAAKGGHGTDFLRGSTTEKVIRYSKVPVFTVDNRLKTEGLKRILIPTDISSISFTCFPLALVLAETYGAEITLFHVLELYGTLTDNVERNPYKSEESNIYAGIIDRFNKYLIQAELDDVLIQRVEEDFSDLIVITDGASKKSIPMKTVIKKGVSAHYEIESYAPEHADLIVMTTHGHSGLAHFFLGSTTEKVAQHVDMPVLTVKPSVKQLEAGKS